jgi:enediyne biosynthesis protein E4
VMVACGPPGLIGGKNILYHNNGDGTFTDVSDGSGVLQANGTYGLGVLTADFDNDGWPDVYVANDSTASALYKNLKNGKFSDVAMESGCALSADGKPQAGMGISAADYDLDGNLDIKILAVECLKTLLFPPALGSTRNFSAGAAVFSIWTTTAGRIF